MMFFKGLLLIHFEKVRCTARAEVLYLLRFYLSLHPMVYDRVHVDETSLDWNSSLLVPVVHADARRAGGCGARFDGDGDGYVRIL